MVFFLILGEMKSIIQRHCLMLRHNFNIFSLAVIEESKQNFVLLHELLHKELFTNTEFPKNVR